MGDMRSVIWDGDNIAEVIMLMHPQEPVYMGKQFSNADQIVGVNTRRGFVVAQIGDAIVKHGDGSLDVERKG